MSTGMFDPAPSQECSSETASKPIPSGDSPL
jgi:hypothetical protein